MQQSNVIVGALFIAFIIFITAKGELPTYIGFLRGVKPLVAGSTVAGMNVLDANNLSAADQAAYAQQNALDNAIPQVNASALSPSAGISISGLPPLPSLNPIGQ